MAECPLLAQSGHVLRLRHARFGFTIDSHAPRPTSNCVRTRSVRALMEYRVYWRPLWPAIYRAVDFPDRADGICRGHHGRDRDNWERPVA